MSALQPVPFKKARGWAPRISAPYERGRRSGRFWTDEEIAIVRRHYPGKGAAYCASLLPRHAARKVYAKANSLGLHRDGLPTERRPRAILTGELAARIREAWPALVGRGAFQNLAVELDLGREALSRFALKLGLTLPYKKEPPWSAAELELLSRVPLHSLATATRIFREHGFLRTEAALMNKAKRLDISRRYTETLSATKAAAILGVDPKNFSLECARGAVTATKREGTNRLPQQGGPAWSIRREDLRQYVLDNLERIDIRKVDRFAFVDLLVNNGPITLPAKRSPIATIPRLRALGFEVRRRRRAA